MFSSSTVYVLKLLQLIGRAKCPIQNDKDVGIRCAYYAVVGIRIQLCGGPGAEYSGAARVRLDTPIDSTISNRAARERDDSRATTSFGRSP
jgi:hypothetical protein